MKRILLFAVFITCISAAFAQRNKLNIGLEGSASSILLYSNYPQFYPYQRSIGYSVAATIQYNFPRILSIRTNVAYEKKGAAYERQSHGITTQMDFDFNYITVPLLLRATLGNKIQFFVNAGPFLGYLLKQKTTTNASPNLPDYDGTTDYDGTADYVTLDAGIAAGAGLGFTASKKFIFSLEIRHNGGLKNIVDQKRSFPNDHQMKTIATNLLIGVCYRLGERD